MISGWMVVTALHYGGISTAVPTLDSPIFETEAKCQSYIDERYKDCLNAPVWCMYLGPR